MCTYGGDDDCDVDLEKRVEKLDGSFEDFESLSVTCVLWVLGGEGGVSEFPAVTKCPRKFPGVTSSIRYLNLE